MFDITDMYLWTEAYRKLGFRVIDAYKHKEQQTTLYVCRKNNLYCLLLSYNRYDIIIQDKSSIKTRIDRITSRLRTMNIRTNTKQEADKQIEYFKIYGTIGT